MSETATLEKLYNRTLEFKARLIAPVVDVDRKPLGGGNRIPYDVWRHRIIPFLAPRPHATENTTMPADAMVSVCARVCRAMRYAVEIDVAFNALSRHLTLVSCRYYWKVLSAEEKEHRTAFFDTLRSLGRFSRQGSDLANAARKLSDKFVDVPLFSYEHYQGTFNMQLPAFRAILGASHMTSAWAPVVKELCELGLCDPTYEPLFRYALRGKDLDKALEAILPLYKDALSRKKAAAAQSEDAGGALSEVEAQVAVISLGGIVDNCTPLHSAVLDIGEAKVAQWLLEKGANPKAALTRAISAEVAEGATPADCALYELQRRKKVYSTPQQLAEAEAKVKLFRDRGALE